MKNMKKIEVIVETVYLNRLLDLLKQKGITGLEGSGIRNSKKMYK